MYLSIIILPLLGSIVSGFFGRKVGVSGAQFITCFNVIITTIFAVIAFFEVGLNSMPVSLALFRWIDSELFNITVSFKFDSLTVCFVALLFLEIKAVLVLIQLYEILFKFFFFIFVGRNLAGSPKPYSFFENTPLIQSRNSKFPLSLNQTRSYCNFSHMTKVESESDSNFL